MNRGKYGGVVYGPYTGRYFDNDRETDTEHIVAASEGHDSGLCEASASRRLQFATDQLNLTLASPEVNRCGEGGKCGLEPAEWKSEKNKCWFANRIVEIKKMYGLSVDKVEAITLDTELSACDSVEMIFYPVNSTSDAGVSGNFDALTLYGLLGTFPPNVTLIATAFVSYGLQRRINFSNIFHNSLLENHKSKSYE